MFLIGHFQGEIKDCSSDAICTSCAICRGPIPPDFSLVAAASPGWASGCDRRAGKSPFVKTRFGTVPLPTGARSSPAR